MKQNGQRGDTREPQTFVFRLDLHSGVPVYRQLIDQVQAAIAAGSLAAGVQLPTVRQVAVDLAINPNTVLRAYREMEIRGLLDTEQGTGTFIADRKIEFSEDERDRKLRQLVGELASRAGAAGFTLTQVMQALRTISPDDEGMQR
jgi:GntR family transcriptional regulator